MTEENDELRELSIPSSKGFPIKISDNLHHKLENHLNSLKMLCKGVSRNKWILDAINEKLNDETLDDKIPEARRIMLYVPDRLKKRLEGYVNAIKKINQGFSQKQLIIEAIHEKFDREHKQVKDELKKLREASSSPSKFQNDITSKNLSDSSCHLQHKLENM